MAQGKGAVLEIFAERVPHIVRVEPSYCAPVLIDYSVFPHTDDAKVLVEGLMHFVSLPILLDDFASDEDRRSWRSACNAAGRGTALEYLDQNPLRVNKVSTLLLHAETLDRLYRGNSPALITSHAQAMWQRWSACDYDALSLDEKIVVIQDLQQKAYSLLTCLAKK